MHNAADVYLWGHMLELFRFRMEILSRRFSTLMRFAAWELNSLQSECRFLPLFFHSPTCRYGRLQTLGAMAHLDFNDPVSHSYEQAFRVTRRVVNDARANEQLFRRMAFNVLAWNCDDHVKNISYLMDRAGEWPRFAAEAGVREDFAAEIAKTLGCAR